MEIHGFQIPRVHRHDVGVIFLRAPLAVPFPINYNPLTPRMEHFRTEIYIHVERVFSIAAPTYMYLRTERYKCESVYFNMAEYSVSITDSLSTSKISIF